MIVNPIPWEVSGPATAFVLGYILGSFPFGLVFSRIFGFGDIRKIGSGNIGTTNVLRTGNKALALATLACDTGKGALAVALASSLDPDLAVFAAFSAVLGHLFPIWLGFRGGKGVATALGVLLSLSPYTGLSAIAVWGLVAILFRISSLSAIVAAASAPVFAWHLGDREVVHAVVVLASLVIYRHRQNIKRLLSGQEPRIGQKKQKQSD